MYLLPGSEGQDEEKRKKVAIVRPKTKRPCSYSTVEKNVYAAKRG